MWPATGTAIAYAPTIAELRHPDAGGENIQFNMHGHNARTINADNIQLPISHDAVLASPVTVDPKERRSSMPQTLSKEATDEKHTWAETARNGLKAAWKFAFTPTGFLMSIYGLNIVAWGAMLFFVLLGAAPAMNHPSKDSIDSPRKKWIEIDSQILNTLFCMTGFGLAPWRFRDLWWWYQGRLQHNKYAMKRLSKQNKSWFRPPAWYNSDEENVDRDREGIRVTFTGKHAPPTSIWKLSFVVWMMILNTLLQGALSGFMWEYNRFNRPSWAAGTFIGLGCGVSMLAGLMMWWEGRKVKKIEGPVVKVVDTVKTESVERESGNR